MSNEKPFLKVLLLMLLFTHGCAPGEGGLSRGLESVTVPSGRSFYVFVPETANGTLVIALHGGATNGRSMARYSGLAAQAETHHFTAVFPNGTGRTDTILTWNAGDCCGYAVTQNSDDVGFVATIIDYAIDQLDIDPDKILLTGMSNGAMLAYRVAAERPELITAIAPIAGTMDVPLDNIRAHVPIIHFHGDSDTHVPFDGGRGDDSAPGQRYTSVADTLAAWRAVSGLESASTVEIMDNNPSDSTSIERISYYDANNRESIVLYKIVGGGHTWPGQPPPLPNLGATTYEIDANELMLAFLTEHIPPGSR